MITAVILAGGRGTRLRSVVQDVPKPMACVNGRPFLEHLVDYWIAQGVSRFVLSVGYKHEIICDHFGSAYRGTEIVYAIEHSALGTGGGLLLAAMKIEGTAPLLVLNGDTYFTVDLAALTAFYNSTNSDVCFSLFSTDEKGRYMGLDISDDGRITSLHSGNNDGSRLSNGGVYLVRPEMLAAEKFIPGARLSLEDDIFSAALKTGQRLFGREFSGDFIDIGIPEDYARAQNMLKA